MKLPFRSAVPSLLLLLALAGCAGSGGGSDNGGGGGPVPTGDVVIEAVVAQGGVIPGSPDLYLYQDPQNIEANQTVQFQLVSYDENGNRTVLPASDWRTSDQTNAYGLIASNSGLFQAGNQASPTVFYVEARYNGQVYSTSYRVQPRQATVVARVVDAATGNPVRGILVEFYNSDDVLVGSVRQPYTGDFRASVPLGAARMNLVPDSIPSGYYRTFLYNGQGYEAGNIDCTVPLPSLNVGQNFVDTRVQVVPRTQAEPDLTGCE